MGNRTIILFCVLIALFRTTLSQDCAPCHCDISEMEVECRNINRLLNNVPENVIKNAQMIQFKKIDFSGQLFTHLSKKQLSHFPQVEHVTLKRNKINSLEPDTFQNLSFLRIIDLSKNQIQNLPQSVFSNLTNVTFISLNNNKITFLQSYLFKDLPKLKEVHLNNNQINHVQANCFVNSPEINTIDLSNNALQQLRMNIIDNVTSVEYFYFDQNTWFCNADLCPVIKTALNLKWLHGRIPECYYESNNTKTDRNWEDILILKHLNINASSDIVEVHEFEDLYLKCQVTSCSKALLKFNTNSRKRKIPKEDYSLNDEENYEIILYLNNVTKADEGVYSCLISNCKFCDKKEIILKVLDKKLTEGEKCAELLENTKKDDETMLNSLSIWLSIALSLSIILNLICACCPMFGDCCSVKRLRKLLCKRQKGTDNRKSSNNRPKSLNNVDEPKTDNEEGQKFIK